MNCPVCARSLAPTLSICPTCGAMMNDTVREELQTKITPGVVQVSRPASQQAPQVTGSRIVDHLAPPPAAVTLRTTKRKATTGLWAPKTSQTLVEFQNKNAPLPDWRLQLQNAVQQRKGSRTAVVATSGGAAAAVAPAKAIEPAPAAQIAMPEISDPRVASAMKRIAASRDAFAERPEVKRPAAPKAPARAYKFDVVSAPAPSTSVPAPSVIGTSKSVPTKPRLVAAPAAEKRDTNKLPRLEGEIVEIGADSSHSPAAEAPLRSGELVSEVAEIARIELRNDSRYVEPDTDISEDEDIEDLAPFSMRFGAGLFDIIIAGFGAMLAVTPFVFSGLDPFTTYGLLMYAGAMVLVLFSYMTISLGFFGKTMGMRLFSLELVDALENEYPTLQQAAVNSSVFIFSLMLGGAGFITAFFNEERRAIHDLLSGTILVREF